MEERKVIDYDIMVEHIVVASIGLGNPWIRYTEKNFYRDYYTNKGILAYCDGEVCVFVKHDENTVTLRNPDIESEEREFTISKEQFDKDFGISVSLYYSNRSV